MHTNDYSCFNIGIFAIRRCMLWQNLKIIFTRKITPANPIFSLVSLPPRPRSWSNQWLIGIPQNHKIYLFNLFNHEIYKPVLTLRFKTKFSPKFRRISKVKIFKKYFFEIAKNLVGKRKIEKSLVFPPYNQYFSYYINWFFHC